MQEVLNAAEMLAVVLLVAGYIQFRRTRSPEGAKRPGWVWAILVYYALAVPLPLAMLTAAVSPNQAMSHVRPPVNAFDFASIAFILLASAVGAAHMFWLRRDSVNIFTAVLAVIILRAGVGLYVNHSLSLTGFWAVAVTTAVVVYGRRLMREEILR
jgi:hypothetical protein